MRTRTLPLIGTPTARIDATNTTDWQPPFTMGGARPLHTPDSTMGATPGSLSRATARDHVSESGRIPDRLSGSAERPDRWSGVPFSRERARTPPVDASLVGHLGLNASLFASAIDASEDDDVVLYANSPDEDALGLPLPSR